MPFERGEAIVERGVFGNRILFARPLTVASHDDDVLATYLPIGTKYFGAIWQSRETAYTEFFRGEVDFGHKTWEQHNVLILVRPGDAYQIMGFWNEAGAFVGWYVNLQAPAKMTPIGYDTQDHALDLIVGEDLNSWLWKDEEELTLCVEAGLYTVDEAVRIRQAGEAVIADLGRGEAWWREWRSFEPDPAWSVPEFPDGWDALAP